MMGFKAYRFCQNWVITLLCSLYSVFSLVFVGIGLSWWASGLIAVGASVLWLLPILSIFLPIGYAAYMIAGLLVLGPAAKAWFYILLAVLVLHVARYVCMLRFAKRYPEISLEYDKAIRCGYKL